MLITALFFVFISVSMMIGLVTPSVREYKISNDSIRSKQSFFLSESGVEDAYYRIKTSRPIGSSETITLNGSSVTTSIVDNGGGSKTITSTGDVSSRQRKNELKVTSGTSVSLFYGAQVGQGGFDMQGSSGINGNVYSNGPITGSSSSFITGTAVSANSVDIENNGTGTPTYNVSFGNTNPTQDIAQSFIFGADSSVGQMQVYIRKNNNPGNATLRILNDSLGSPGTTVLATSTLDSSKVLSSYSWVNLPLSVDYTFVVGTRYWFVLDMSSSNSSNYYIIGGNNDGYSSGSSKIGQNGSSWNNNSPSTLDYYFSIGTGFISGDSQYNQLHIGTSSGNADAHVVNNTDSDGLIYCQKGINNNQACSTHTDSTFTDFPIPNSYIDQWKDDAVAGGTYSGNYSVGGSSTVSLGPKYITGNLTVSNSGTLYITGTLWVQGNLTLSGSGKIRLHSSYGANDGVIVVDGTITVSGSGQFLGSGTPGSYILALTTNNCDSSTCPTDAVEASGSAGRRSRPWSPGCCWRR
jgi:hypothetical protein